MSASSVSSILSWEIQVSTPALLLIPMERLPGQRTCKLKVGYSDIQKFLPKSC